MSNKDEMFHFQHFNCFHSIFKILNSEYWR